MLLEHQTWPLVQEYLKRSTGVIVPIGSTEQHGPSGPLGTDALCAQVLARLAGEKAEALVAPTLFVGMSEHHMAFPGSITFLPSTLLAVVRDVVISLARHGFDRIFIVNGHGGNLPTLRAALSEVYALAATRSDLPESLRGRVMNWWETEAVQKMTPALFGDKEGSHATPGELSVVFHAHPETIRTAPDLPPAAPSADLYGAKDFRRRYPDGRIGSDPSLARADIGARLAEAASDDLARIYTRFLAER